VIFLDIDGVLAPIRRWDRYGDLDPACIHVLNDIVARVGADVVVSSTWRHGKTVAELQEILQAEGFTGCVVDKTPTGAPGADRGDEIAAWLAEHAPNVHPVGRNGMHRYNNQDHSMWTAILATLNLLDGTDYDVWSVNTEAEYHEEKDEGGEKAGAAATRGEGASTTGGPGRESPTR